MKVLVRGDCTSRRMIMLNRDKFCAPVSLVTNERAPNAVHADHISGVVARPEVVSEHLDESTMGKSQLLHFRRQFERNVLSEIGAALLVIDPYSEMNYPLYRHREEGWRFWVPHHSIVNMKRFSSTFETCGYQSFEESLENTEIVIKHIINNNPDMPVLFMPQLLDYHSHLKERECFNDLGRALSSSIPDLFVGSKVPFEDIVPEYLDKTGGEEQTLYFSASTYWKQVAQSVEEGGLLEKTKRCQENILKAHHNSASFKADECNISLLRDPQNCIAPCELIIENVKRTVQQYFVIKDDTFIRTKELKYRSAIIDLKRYRNYAEYESEVKKISNGGRIRMRNNAKKAAFYCKPFHWYMHTPDIYEINTSTDTRGGEKIRLSSQKTVHEMGGPPKKIYEPAEPKCIYHWAYPWGVFEKCEGHKQGDIVVDEKLVGYIFLRRYGEILLYSLVMGHYEYFNKNVMNILHHNIMQWLLGSNKEQVKNIKAVMYGGYDQGGDVLMGWKRREGFEPFLVVVDD